MNYLKMAIEHINYWDTGKEAREKINSIMDEVEASIPSIWENWHWYIGGVDTWITAVWLELRVANNLIKQNSNRETFTDLQFQNGLTPTSIFPIGVNIGNVDSQDGWDVSWVLLNALTTDWHYARWLYGDDWKLYFDGWRGVFKKIAIADEVMTAIAELRNELSNVAFTGLSSDLNNDAWFTADDIVTKEEYEAIWPSTESDDKRYILYKTVTK